MTDSKSTIWVLGDQLNRRITPLIDATPENCRILVVHSEGLIGTRAWHRQRLHLVLSAMSHFVQELEDEGFEVDRRRAPSFTAGLSDHRAEYDPDRVVVMEPANRAGSELVDRLDVDVLPNNQFLCDRNEFATWARRRRRPTMEQFYRWQRQRLDLLMDGDRPVGGRWNYDHDNREPPPRDGRTWPGLTRFALDEIDQTALDDVTSGWGAPPDGTWPVTRRQALIRLEEFVERALPVFGPHEDAMLHDEWKLAHSALSSALNIGLLHPAEVVEATTAAYRAGQAPIESVEGFVRQVAGWREYVHGVYWMWGPEYRNENQLGATRPIPPAFTGDAETKMVCLDSVLARVHRHGYAHHIERLMVLGNLALTAGIEPRAMTDWMRKGFVDGADWVMTPNVVGMALHADGGRMATKPYAAGGAYINRMSDFCGTCRYDPKQRTGPNACPFTTLYWDFLARNETSLAGNHRMGRPLAGMRRLANLDEVREHAVSVLSALDEGQL